MNLNTFDWVVACWHLCRHDLENYFTAKGERIFSYLLYYEETSPILLFMINFNCVRNCQ